MKRLIKILVGLGLAAFFIVKCSQMIANLAEEFHTMARIAG